MTQRQINRMSDYDEARRKAEASAKAARDGWIAEHGSSRLKKAAEAGLKHTGIYRKERLALELPGWEYWEDGAQDETDHNEIINPTEPEIDALLDARKKYPDGDVELWSIFNAKNHESRTYIAALAMFCPWDNSDAVIFRLADRDAQ